MCRRAEAEVVPAVPIDEVVLPLIAGLCKVGDLVLLVAVVFQLLDGVEIKVRRFVRGGQPLRRMPAKRGVRLDLEQIGRDVGGTAALDQLQRLVELRLRIMGQGQHDVAADVLKACPPRG